MFGLVVAGNPVDAAPQEIAPQQYAFKVNSATSFNHIVIFLLPGTTLPPGAAAAVYIQTSSAQGPKFYGAIGPGKESAIFKLNGVGGQGSADIDSMSDEPHTINSEVMVGIALEAGGQVDAKIAELKASSSTALVRATLATTNAISTKQLAKNIIGNAFDYLASFGSDTIPLKVFQDWWTKFEKKIDLDPSFIERARNG